MQEKINLKKSHTGAKKITKEKIIYKNQKRKVRNRLIYLVGIHLLFIFIFCGFMSIEYLINWDWMNVKYFSIASDVIYLLYFVETLIAIKFKNRKTLVLSIFTLSLAIGTKTTCFFILFRELNDHMIIILCHLLLLIFNFFIPVSLLFLWNKLKQDKWRETFDLHTKLNNHLDKDQSETVDSQAIKH